MRWGGAQLWDEVGGAQLGRAWPLASSHPAQGTRSPGLTALPGPAGRRGLPRLAVCWVGALRGGWHLFRMETLAHRRHSPGGRAAGGRGSSGREGAASFVSSTRRGESLAECRKAPEEPRRPAPGDSECLPTNQEAPLVSPWGSPPFPVPTPPSLPPDSGFFL